MEDKPLFETRGKSYGVIDISEQGLAINIEAGDTITNVKASITGKIIFKDKETVTVTGKILRFTKDQVIFVLQQGVPLQTVMKQQRILLQKYGKLEA
jgi:ribosomal protein L27